MFPFSLLIVKSIRITISISCVHMGTYVILRNVKRMRSQIENHCYGRFNRDFIMDCIKHLSRVTNGISLSGVTLFCRSLQKLLLPK